MNEQEKKEEGQTASDEVPPQYSTAELTETVSPSELHNSQILSEISSNEAGRYELSTLSSPTQHSSDT